MIRLILSGHSRIEIPPETWYLQELVRYFSLSEPLSPPEVSRAIDIMTGHFRWPDMEIDAGDLRAKATALSAPRLVDIVNVVYFHHLKRSGKARFGDKTPPYINILPELSALYPEAKFINLIRDGRDVAISCIDLHWPDRCYQRDFVWTASLRKRETYRRSPINDRILDLRYEDLVADLEGSIRRVCAFLGEEFEPKMLEFQSHIVAIPARERDIHRKIGQPVRTDMVAGWRNKLSGFECFIMESCMRTGLRRWGYPLRFAHAGWQPLLVATSWILFGIGPLLTRLLPYLQRRNWLQQRIYL